MNWIFWTIFQGLIFLQVEGSTPIIKYHDESLVQGMRDRREAFDTKAFRSNQIEQLIPASYSSIEPPPSIDGSPTKVNLSIIVMNIRGIDEKEEEMTLEINIRMFWRDLRLGHFANATGNNSFVVLSPQLIQQLWHPDIFIDHAISVSQPYMISKPASLRMYPDSVIRYSSRITVTIACEMDFRLYPVDIQSCPVQMMSYAYPNKILLLEWAEKRGAYFAHKVNLPNFNVDLDQNQRQTTHTTSADYSNLQFTIILQRDMAYHLIQTYIPSFFLVITSWVVFLIPKKNVAERISCCMVCLLSLTVMFGSLGQNAPKVSYMTALHIWMLSCVIFVFLSFTEFVIVLKIWSLATAEMEAIKSNKLNGSKRRKRESKNHSAINYAFEMTEMPTRQDSIVGGHNLTQTNKEGKYANIARRLEKVTFLALPSLFFVFNLVYWPWLYFM